MNRRDQTPSRGARVRRLQDALRQVSLQLQGLNGAVGSHIDLTAGDLVVLDLIARTGPLSVGDVGAATGVHAATLTGVLDRLEAGGWLERRRDPQDRRRVEVAALGRRGGELVRLYGPMNRAIGRLCADLDDDELIVIIEFLDRIALAGAEAAREVRRQPGGGDAG